MSRSGTATTPNTARKRPMVMITLSPEAIERLDELMVARAESLARRGLSTTRSGMVEALILGAKVA